MKSKHEFWLKFFFLLNSIETFLTFIYILGIPTDPKNASFLGFSWNRVIIVAALMGIFLVCIWLTVIYYRETRLSKGISATIIRFLKNKRNLWVLITTLTLGIFGCVWILVQWFFVGTNQQIFAYLQRITPMVFYGMFASIQGLIFIVRYFLQGKRNWLIFSLVVFGVYIFFLWSLIGEYYLTNMLFPNYYISERYGKLYHNFMPFVLFFTTVFIQIPFIYQSNLGVSLNKNWLYMPMIILLVYFYFNAASLHAKEMNNDIGRSDQLAYVNFTQQVFKSEFSYTGARNRTPGYPFFQAFFCGNTFSDADIFSCGKRVNVILSLVLLGFYFLLIRRHLILDSTVVLCLITAFSLSIFKSGYFQTELLYYFLSFFGFLLMCHMMIEPNSLLGLATGLILGLAYYFKASMLPGIFIFLLVFFTKEFINIYNRKQLKGKLYRPNTVLKSISGGILVITAFICVVFPYIKENKEVYDRYFYNVNSTFYIWYDSFEEAKEAERMYKFREGLPSLPTDQVPSLPKYLQDHDLLEILQRFSQGILHQALIINNQYGTFNYVKLFSFILVIAFLLNRNKGYLLLRRHISLIIFVVLYFVGYLCLFAWYTPISGSPRFILSLFVPFLFILNIGIQALTTNFEFHVFDKRIEGVSIQNLLNIFVMGLVIFDAYIVITELLPAGYYGS